MPRAIYFDEMTRNSVLSSFIFSSCDSIHFCTDAMHFSICPIAVSRSGGLKTVVCIQVILNIKLAQ